MGRGEKGEKGDSSEPLEGEESEEDAWTTREEKRNRGEETLHRRYVSLHNIFHSFFGSLHKYNIKKKYDFLFSLVEYWIANMDFVFPKKKKKRKDRMSFVQKGINEHAKWSPQHSGGVQL